MLLLSISDVLPPKSSSCPHPIQQKKVTQFTRIPYFLNSLQCPTIDSRCTESLHVASRVVEPICDAGTELDASSKVCYSPCSKLSSSFTKYTVYNKDTSSCLPSCPAGYTFTGVEDDRAQCAKCADGATLGQSSLGVWRCSQEGLPDAKPTIRSRALRDRSYKGSSCPEGSYTDEEGVCYACGAVATPGSIAAGAPAAGPFVDGIDTEDVELYAVVFDTAVTGRSAPMCIPEMCCTSTAGEYTGDDGDGDINAAPGPNDVPAVIIKAQTDVSKVITEGR